MKEKIVFLILILNIFVITANLRCIAKINEKEKVPVFAECNTIGELNCPSGFKANCPKQYKPSCVFVGTKHLPSCLADNADDTFYSFDLKKITCEKTK